MSRKGKVVPGVVIGAAVLGRAFAMLCGEGRADAEPRSIVVERGTTEAKALAVGAVQPETEITVKSTVSGVVQAACVEEGVHVRAVDNLRMGWDRIRALGNRNVATVQKQDRTRRLCE